MPQFCTQLTLYNMPLLTQDQLSLATANIHVLNTLQKQEQTKKFGKNVSLKCQALSVIFHHYSNTCNESVNCPELPRNICDYISLRFKWYLVPFFSLFVWLDKSNLVLAQRLSYNMYDESTLHITGSNSQRACIYKCIYIYICIKGDADFSLYIIQLHAK